VGVHPTRGRGFLPDEDQPGRDRVVIVSQAFWQRQLGADPHVVGQTMMIDRTPFTVIGVLPPNVLRYSSHFLKPPVSADYPTGREHRDLDVFARLKPGVTLAQVQAAL